MFLQLSHFDPKAMMTESVNFDVAKIARRIGQQRQKHKYLIEELGGSKEYGISLELIWKKREICLGLNRFEVSQNAIQVSVCCFDTTEPATEVDRKTSRTDM